MSGGNFASLTAGLLVRKGEAEPSPVMPADVFPFPLRVVQAPVDAPVPAGETPQRKRRELPDESTGADVGAYTGAGASARPRRMVVQLSANECEALALVALKSGTTPEQLLRKMLNDFLVVFIEECLRLRGP